MPNVWRLPLSAFADLVVIGSLLVVVAGVAWMLGRASGAVARGLFSSVMVVALLAAPAAVHLLTAIAGRVGRTRGLDRSTAISLLASDDCRADDPLARAAAVSGCSLFPAGAPLPGWVLAAPWICGCRRGRSLRGGTDVGVPRASISARGRRRCGVKIATSCQETGRAMASLSSHSLAVVLAIVLIAGHTPDCHAQSGWQPSAGHVQIPLWPDGPPDPRSDVGKEAVHNAVDRDTGNKTLVAGQPYSYVENVTRPTITVYAPAKNDTGAAVIVYPGGGFSVLATPASSVGTPRA